MSIGWWGMSVQSLNKSVVHGSPSELIFVLRSVSDYGSCHNENLIYFSYCSFSRPVSWKKKTKLSSTRVAYTVNCCLQQNWYPFKFIYMILFLFLWNKGLDHESKSLCKCSFTPRFMAHPSSLVYSLMLTQPSTGTVLCRYNRECLLE